MRCTKCGRYVRLTSYIFNGFGGIKKVNAMCAKHGLVHPTDWYYEEVVGDTQYEEIMDKVMKDYHEPDLKPIGETK